MSKPVRYFGARREPAVMVEDVRKLKVGSIVWWSPCVCGSEHRAILISNPRVDHTASRVTARHTNPQWLAEVLPMRACVVRDRFYGDAVTELAVAEGGVYAVILEPPANTETRERAREREDVL